MLILNYQRMSTEDGPGLRTTLFVKGCPLACKWCHNPESISVKKQTEWISVRCIGCGSCVKMCPQKALTAEADGIKINRTLCKACGACVEKCPTGAMEMRGAEKSVGEIFDELIKDKAYFGSDGGVTLSGGEIMLQTDGAAALLKMLKENGIGTAVDTSGLAEKSAFDKIFPYADVFLYDIKLIDSKEHKKFTGVSNEVILNNFDYLADKIKDTDKMLWVRTPVIPDATDTDENIRGIAKFIKGKYDRWEMCAFNNLCRDKYERLDILWDYRKTQLMTKKRMNELLNIALNEGLKEVYITGATRLEED